MLPLHDANRSASTPWVNYALITACVAVFALEVVLPAPALDHFVRTFGFVPARVHQPQPLWELVYPFFTSMFLHGGWMHLIGNMLYLFIFGDNVEDRFGHAGYLVFYLLCGLAATGTQFATDPGSTIPNIGASGAIAGVLGAYLVMFPGARVTTLVFTFFITVVEIPALVLLGLWFVMQFFSGLGSLGSLHEGGVAYWAHVGGFVAGLVLVKLFDRGPRRFRRLEHPYGVWDEYD
ncbi:MAG TPA: rhomboid family intramembrane serine protease [Candidatus Nitrosotenuis sp.]|jgi:membrane associated rhomboid family serine protease|nr:rhomboid family intramembrane serine protease [Candidatus Nitrosotenuis sp.]